MSPRTTSRDPGSVAEVMASPEGDHITAFFDLDGTFVAGFTVTIYTKARLRSRDMGPPEFLRMLYLVLGFQAGRASFEDLIVGGAAAFRGRPEQELLDASEEIFEQRIADLLYPETRALARAHKDRGHRVVLCSSATNVQVEPVARYLGIDEIVCNRFDVDGEGKLTGTIVDPIIYGPGKAEAAQRYALEHDLDLQDCYFYADGDEDVALMHLVGNPRPTNPGPELTRVAKRRGWPVTRYRSRGAGGVTSLVRSALGVGSLGPISAGAIGVGVARGDKRKGLNVITGLWPRLLLEANGVRLKVIGEHNLTAARPAIFVFNHRNQVDPFIVGALVKDNFTGVAKKELKSNPIFGSIGRLMDMAFIDRDDAESAVATLTELERLANKGLSIVISPEGTRLDTTEVGPFKKGAFRMAMSVGLPIVPVVIRNAHEVAGRNSLTMNPADVDVAVLKPIPVDDWTLEDLPARIEAVRDQFLDVLADWPVEGDPRV